MHQFPARLAALAILLCGTQPAWPQGLAPGARGPASIDAERIEGVTELEVTARGRAEFRREDLSIYAEFMRYNQEFGRVEADGGVRLQRGIDRFFGPRLRYNTQNDTGVLEQPTYLMGIENPARGSAERLEFLGKDRVRLTRATFTTCEPGREDWTLEARELDLDYETEEGTARGMRLRMFDTTILAFPYATFPLERRRKSGFLAPTYSHSTRRGVEVGIPYYWNIAPEQDLTITPSYMSKRGEQLKSTYRYVGRNYGGQLRVEYMPNDDVIKRPRSGFSFQHDQTFLPNLIGRLDLNKVSDDRYFVDLATHVRQVSVGNLQREGLLAYSTSFFGLPSYLQGYVQRFQTLQDPLSPTVSPYHRVPQILFGATKTELADRFDVTVPGEYVRFLHSSLVEGSRTSFNPVASMPLLAPGYFITPRVGMRSAHYALHNTAPGQPQRQGVNVPWTTLDGGLIFERGMKLFGENVTQTLEPRLFYLYAPYRAQDQIPLFDTALADFNYAQLFSENRFSGGDRFGDANELTLAATSRFLDSNGQELFRATLGQRYYFKNERVGLTAASPLRSRDQSDLLASVGGRLTQAWTFDGTVQYNPQQSRAERYTVSARYAPEIAKVISASYRFNREILHQVDISGQWPVQPGWYAIGRYNYSIRDRRVLEGIAGIEYNAGCWVFRGVFQRLQAATQTTSTGIYMQLEFNGLGQIGSDDTVDFLRRSVPGYARTNPTDPQLVPPSLRRRLPFEQVF